MRDSNFMNTSRIGLIIADKNQIELNPLDLMEENGFNNGWILVDFFNQWWQDREISEKYKVSNNEKKNNNILRSYFSLEVLTLEVVSRLLLPKLVEVDTNQIQRFWPEHFPLAKSYNPIRVYLQSNNLTEASRMKRILSNSEAVKVSKNEIFAIADELFLGVRKEMLMLNDFILDGKYEDFNLFAKEYKKAYKAAKPLKATEEFVVRDFLCKVATYKPDTILLALDLAKSREYNSKSKLGFKSLMESIKTAELVLKPIK
jgi:hypothetical protein